MSSRPQTSGTYVIASSANEYDRLIRVGHAHDEHVQDGCRRAGLSAGGRVVDVGCGPLGALLSLANVVGPSGSVLGIDINAEALNTAAAILTQRGLSNVQLVRGDLNSMALDHVPGAGSFDVAYCRLFLIHQRDPAFTLRRMSALVKPGGRLLVQERMFGDKADLPAADPPFPARVRWLQLISSAMERAGASPRVACQLGRVCAAAGLEELSQRSFFYLSGPRNALESLQIEIQGLRGVEKTIFEFGLATTDELQALVAEYEAAKSVTYNYWVGCLYNELLARAPER
jgi:ubiquinone/menaquinone biosynthesis C-methylase UbiE